jgi:hypothetical protein
LYIPCLLFDVDMGLKLGVPNDLPFYTPHPPLFATTNGSIVRPVLNSLEKKRKNLEL